LPQTSNGFLQDAGNLETKGKTALEVDVGDAGQDARDLDGGAGGGCGLAN